MSLNTQSLFSYSESGEMPPLVVGVGTNIVTSISKGSISTYEHAQGLGDDQVHVAGVLPGGQRVAEPGGGGPPG